MATIPLNLHLDYGDIPTLVQIFEHSGEQHVTAMLGGGLRVITTPRALRVYADALTAVADEACRREDELTDEPENIGLDLDKHEAIKAVRAAAHESDDGTRYVHCFVGFIGADWTERNVIEAIEVAKNVRWTDHMIGHDLVVEHSERTYYFDVASPMRAVA